MPNLTNNPIGPRASRVSVTTLNVVYARLPDGLPRSNHLANALLHERPILGFNRRQRLGQAFREWYIARGIPWSPAFSEVGRRTVSYVFGKMYTARKDVFSQQVYGRR